ncbi:hypothetical protein D3C84_456970 [compost metagenome]
MYAKVYLKAEILSEAIAKKGGRHLPVGRWHAHYAATIPLVVACWRVVHLAAVLSRVALKQGTLFPYRVSHELGLGNTSLRQNCNVVQFSIPGITEIYEERKTSLLFMYIENRIETGV